MVYSIVDDRKNNFQRIIFYVNKIDVSILNSYLTCSNKVGADSSHLTDPYHLVNFLVLLGRGAGGGGAIVANLQIVFNEYKCNSYDISVTFHEQKKTLDTI